MSRVEWHGVTLNKRSAKMMDEVQRHCGFRIRPSQGSYSHAAASAGTHSGPGAIDISVRGLTSRQVNRLVKWMRIVGWAAWYRPTLPGVWGEHVHGIAIGTKGLPRLAAQQVTAYKLGRDGLAGNRLDRHRGMHIKPTTWERYLRAKRAKG